jgi:hypothetical protein
MFSAYTIRKVLPRLLIAAVAIQLSWSLCLFAISLNNDIARGLEGLIYAPFGGIHTFVSLGSLVQAQGGNAAAFSGTAVFGAVAAGGAYFAVGSGSLVGIFALAATAALGILIALVTLVMRRAILIFLIVVSPLAIVAWVLPGTERLWKLWWESFSKLLIMYPLILLLIAAGRLFAYVSVNSGQHELLAFILVIIGFFGPLFMIPATFKLAGSAFTAVSGAVNSRNKGVFDRLSNARAKQAETNRGNFMAGQRFNDHRFNPITKGFNAAGRHAAAGLGGRFGYGSRGKSIMEGNASLSAAELEKRNQLFAANKEDEKVMKLLSMGRSRGAAQEWINREAAAMERNGESAASVAAFKNNYGQALETASAIGFNQTSRRAAMMSGGAISYGFKSGEAGWNEATGAMKELAGMSADTSDADAAKNQTYRNLMNQFQYQAKGMGRADLAGGTDGGSYDGNRAWSSVGLYQHANGKPDSIKGALATYTKMATEAANGRTADGTVLSEAEKKERLIKASVFAAEMDQLIPNATGGVRDEAVKAKAALQGLTVNGPAGARRVDVTDEANLAQVMGYGVEGDTRVAGMKAEISQRSRTYKREDADAAVRAEG